MPPKNSDAITKFYFVHAGNATDIAYTYAVRLPLEHSAMVEDYTNAFLVSAFVLTFLALFTIWAIWGLLMASLVGWAADRLITIDFRCDDH